MSLSLVFSMIITVLLVSAKAWPSTLSSAQQMKDTMDAALDTGDFFRAYRTGVAMEELHAKDFPKSGMDGYFKSLFVVGSTEQVAGECNYYAPQSAVAAYLCGLHAYENKGVDESIKYLNLVDKKTKFFWPAQIVLASAQLLKNKPELALENLKPEEVGGFKLVGLEQLFYLTRARVLLALGRHDEAIKFSQAVDSYSPYYVDALEQTAWAFFKIRKFESSQILLDVLISSFESPKKSESDLKISKTLYFRARYLKAYLALLEQRPENASSEFSQLKGDYDKFLKEFRKELMLDPVKRNFSGNGLQDMKNFPETVETHLTFISEWLGAETYNDYAAQMRYQVALNKEIERLKKLKGQENKDYLDNLQRIKTQSFQKLDKDYKLSLARLEKALETLSLKSELGRLDVFWLNRAQGARTLEEVIENYQQTTQSVESYIDL